MLLISITVELIIKDILNIINILMFDNSTLLKNSSFIFSVLISIAI